VIDMLSERQRLILNAVINDYIQTAEPVGSRSLAKRYHLGVSPATIRNEMADLGEMGYLEQPHTSAGRIPSYKGYRYYVDCLMEVEKLTPEEEEELSQILQQRLERIDTVFRQASKALSNVSRYISLVMSPFVGQQIFCEMRLIPLDAHYAIILLFTDTGLVQNRIMEIPPGVLSAELDSIAQLFNRRLAGLPLEQINSIILQDIYQEFARKNEALQQVIERLLASLTYQSETEKVYLGGTTNILRQPEFNNVEKVRGLLQVLEEQELLCELLTADTSNEIAVIIGEENKCLPMKGCSIVTARYAVDGKLVGTIGILGPTRMDYPKVISVVEFMQKLLSETLQQLIR
jgi:heat-inducible transcriptional repressor